MLHFGKHNLSIQEICHFIIDPKEGVRWKDDAIIIPQNDDDDYDEIQLRLYLRFYSAAQRPVVK
jgi:hypothetical protein